MPAPSTMIEKILARTSGQEKVSAGDIVTARVDLAGANDVTAPITVAGMRQAGVARVFDPKRVFIVAGRHTPFKEAGFAAEVRKLGEFSAAQGMQNFWGFGEGMEHALLPELGMIRPGMLICNADSHTCTFGALGALGLAMGSTDMAYIFAFGETWLMVPPTMRIEYVNKPGRFVTSKDYVLATLREIGVDGARYKSIEFVGEAIASLSMDERFTISNMAIEMGAKTGMMEPDATTEAYLSTRTSEPYTSVRSDVDATFERTIRIDVGGLTPLVAKPHSPSNVVPVGELRGTKVTQVNIGTCTNGRFVDLERAASILRGHKVAKGVHLIVTPATNIVYSQALKAGLLDVFCDAGAVINPPGCGPCAGGFAGQAEEADVCMTTHNRNFPGRMGHKDAQIYLASPYVAAATAIAGAIMDPNEVVQ